MVERIGGRVRVEESGADGKGRARGKGVGNRVGRCQGGRSRCGVGGGVVLSEGTEGGEKGFWVGGAGCCATAENAGVRAVTGVNKVMC